MLHIWHMRVALASFHNWVFGRLKCRNQAVESPWISTFSRGSRLRTEHQQCLNHVSVQTDRQLTSRTKTTVGHENRILATHGGGKVNRRPPIEATRPHHVFHTAKQASTILGFTGQNRRRSRWTKASQVVAKYSFLHGNSSSSSTGVGTVAWLTKLLRKNPKRSPPFPTQPRLKPSCVDSVQPKKHIRTVHARGAAPLHAALYRGTRRPELLPRGAGNSEPKPASQPPGRAGVTEQGKYTTEGDLGRGFGGLTSALSGEGGRKKRRPRRGEDRRRRNDLQWCTGCFSEGCLFIYRENGHRATGLG